MSLEQTRKDEKFATDIERKLNWKNSVLALSIWKSTSTIQTIKDDLYTYLSDNLHLETYNQATHVSFKAMIDAFMLLQDIDYIDQWVTYIAISFKLNMLDGKINAIASKANLTFSGVDEKYKNWGLWNGLDFSDLPKSSLN